MNLFSVIKEYKKVGEIIGIIAYEYNIEAIKPGNNTFITNDEPKLVGTLVIVISLNSLLVDILLHYIFLSFP
jgi:replication initiation and membrane attachment protein DnaB